MESNYYTLKRDDKQLIVITHLTQLLTYITGFGGLIIPLIIWLTQKESINNMDLHGRAILNFQLSTLIYSIISIPLIFLFGLGILILIAVCILAFVMPIVNAVKANNGEMPHYPLSLKIV